MGRARPPRIHRYSAHFKATAVRLSYLRDVLIQDVADARTSTPSCCHAGASKPGRDSS